MNYGLYLSASGVLASSHRQDVIANNIANAETVGFKRDLPLFQQRLTEAQLHRDLARYSDPRLETLGGGMFVTPNTVDHQQGELESTGNNFDLAIEGRGYFAVDDHGLTRLTRNGRLQMDSQGCLILANGQNQKVLDNNRQPIVLEPRLPTTFSRDGQITQNGKPVGQIGVFDVAETATLQKKGGTLFACPDAKALRPSSSAIRNQFLERANVDPATELTALMDAQRQLEANANMIRYQDQMLNRLNDVGKIS